MKKSSKIHLRHPFQNTTYWKPHFSMSAKPVATAATGF